MSITLFCRAPRCSLQSDDQDGGENEFSVTEGTSGQLKLLAPRTPGAYVLRVDARPLVASGAMPKLDATIVLDGIVIGQITVREPSAWVMALPRELTEKRDILRLNFRLAEARKQTGLRPFRSHSTERHCRNSDCHPSVARLFNSCHMAARRAGHDAASRRGVSSIPEGCCARSSRGDRVGAGD